MTTEKGLTITPVNALPTSLEEVKGMADAFIKSGMFPDTKSLAQAMVKIQAGRELGLPPVYSMQNINLIRDRLTTSANTMAMMVKRSGKYNYRIGSHTDTECKIEFLEGGKSVGWSTFTIDDAKRANLVKPDSGWVKFPRAMLFSRAISQGARIYAPDAIGGIYTDEEIRSIPPNVESVTGEITTSSPDAPESSQDEQGTQEKPKAVESGGEADKATERDLLIGLVIHWLKLRGNKAATSALDWLTNVEKIPQERIDTEPKKVALELIEKQGWK